MIDVKTIEEIKLRNPIEDVMAGYVNLKRSGSNMICSCPFHSEKTPSCTVFLSEQSFYCFGCGAGGDVISFIRRIENQTYPEALEFLAKRAGIALIQSDTVTAEKRYDRTRFYEMNKAAARYFRDCFYDATLGAQAREYTAKRKLSDPIVKRFGLGYSPNSFGALKNYMNSLGFTDEELTLGFLCGKSKNNTAYDYFRGRLMFPIFDTGGNIIAFGGRVLDSSEPKYLNSSDTPVFKKKNNLFALNYAKNNCKENLILCEGYLDVISLHDVGIENAVATLGTAITPEQARLMAKYTKKVIIAYDFDDAGRRAADKAVMLLQQAGLEVRLLKLSGAKDPDEFVRKYGVDAFRKELDTSRTKFNYYLESILAKYDIKNPADQVKAAKEACLLISDVYSSTEREIYANEASQSIGISKESIIDDIERVMKKKLSERNKEAGRMFVRKTAGYGDRINPDFAKNIKAANAEEMILGLMLNYEEYRQKAAYDENFINENDFITELGKKIFASVVKLVKEGSYSESLLGIDFTVDEMSRLKQIQIKNSHNNPGNNKAFSDAAAVLKNEKKLFEIKNEKGEDGEDIKVLLDLKRKK